MLRADSIKPPAPRIYAPKTCEPPVVAPDCPWKDPADIDTSLPGRCVDPEPVKPDPCVRFELPEPVERVTYVCPPYDASSPQKKGPNEILLATCRDEVSDRQQGACADMNKGSCAPYVQRDATCKTCKDETGKVVDESVQRSRMPGRCYVKSDDPDYVADSYEDACNIYPGKTDRNTSTLEAEGICPIPQFQVGPKTSDTYQTCKLPGRFEYPACFTGFGCQKRPNVHPFYRTTSGDYGWYPPSVHTVPTSYHPNNQQFTTQQSIGGMYRNYGLNMMSKEDAGKVEQQISCKAVYGAEYQGLFGK